MIITKDKWDTAILFGSDMDYIPLIKILQNSSKSIHVIGGRTSLKMINCAEKFTYLKDLENIISRK